MKRKSDKVTVRGVRKAFDRIRKAAGPNKYCTLELRKHTGSDEVWVGYISDYTSDNKSVFVHGDSPKEVAYQFDKCSMYPSRKEGFDGTCGAGSEITDVPCSKKDEEECEYRREHREREGE